MGGCGLAVGARAGIAWNSCSGARYQVAVTSGRVVTLPERRVVLLCGDMDRAEPGQGAGTCVNGSVGRPGASSARPSRAADSHERTCSLSRDRLSSSRSLTTGVPLPSRQPCAPFLLRPPLVLPCPPQGYCHWVNVVLMQDASLNRCWLMGQAEYMALAPPGSPPPPLCSALVMEYCDMVRKGVQNAGGTVYWLDILSCVVVVHIALVMEYCDMVRKGEGARKLLGYRAPVGRLVMRCGRLCVLRHNPRWPSRAISAWSCGNSIPSSWPSGRENTQSNDGASRLISLRRTLRTPCAHLPGCER